MRSNKLKTTGRLLVIVGALAVPATAMAHAKLVTPKPRLDDDGLKSGPCGNTPRTKAFVQYQPGQEVAVTWREGIDHGGCFDVLFSPANDANWVRLGRYDDTNLAGNIADASTTKMVTLPAGVKCENCTLALRQLMNTGDALCNANTQDEMDGGVPTYFSCADIRVGDFPDAGTSVEEDASVPGAKDSGGPTTVPTDGGGKFVDAGDDGSNAGPPNLRSGEGDGCSVTALGATSGLSFGVAAGLFGLALLRRRRNRA